MRKPSVCVMMSVYNGERFLKEQIDSILAQEGVDVRLVVRDDGSKDASLDILKSYGDRLQIIYGSNMGAAESFMEVAFAAPMDSDHYAFSDADDVWLPAKLISAIRLIESEPQPAVVVSRLQVVDENLKPIELSFRPSGFSFDNALVQCVLGGAGSLFNHQMFEILRQHRPQTLVMHDAWLYLIATAFGKIVYQEEPHVLYRQHSAQVFGAGGFQGAKATWKRRLHSILGNSAPFREQAEEFLIFYGDRLSPEKFATANRFVRHKETIGRRASFASSPGLRFTTRKSEILYRLRAFIGTT